MVAECIFHLNRQTTRLFQLVVLVVMHETCLDERQSAVGSSGMPKSRAVDISERQLALSGHFIQRDDPRAVTAIVRTAVLAARRAPTVLVGG